MERKFNWSSAYLEGTLEVGLDAVGLIAVANELVHAMLTADAALQAGTVLHARILPHTVEGQMARYGHLGEAQGQAIHLQITHAALEAQLIDAQSLVNQPAAHLLLHAAKEDALLEIYGRLGVISVLAPISGGRIVQPQLRHGGIIAQHHTMPFAIGDGLISHELHQAAGLIECQLQLLILDLQQQEIVATIEEHRARIRHRPKLKRETEMMMVNELSENWEWFVVNGSS